MSTDLLEARRGLPGDAGTAPASCLRASLEWGQLPLWEVGRCGQELVDHACPEPESEGVAGTPLLCPGSPSGHGQYVNQ